MVTDWCSIYENVRIKKQTPFRRQKARYLGLIDFKLAAFCGERITAKKKAGKNMSAEGEQHSEIIQQAFRSGDDMENASGKLLKLAEQLDAGI